MKRLYKLFALVGLFLGASVALADSAATNVTVSSIEARNGGQFFVYLTRVARLKPARKPTSGIAGSPACATNTTGYVIDATTTDGQEEIKIAELAYSLGKTVTAGGLGTCLVYAGSETMSYIITTD